MIAVQLEPVGQVYAMFLKMADDLSAHVVPVRILDKRLIKQFSTVGGFPFGRDSNEGFVQQRVQLRPSRQGSDLGADHHVQRPRL